MEVTLPSSRKRKASQVTVPSTEDEPSAAVDVVQDTESPTKRLKEADHFLQVAPRESVRPKVAFHVP